MTEYEKSKLSGIWTTLRSYFGLGGNVRHKPIASPENLLQFLEERASFVAQVSLYGYLRTRAGMRYPELFDDDVFVASINIAKWHLWLDCLADITVYTGSRIAQQAPRETSRVARLMAVSVDDALLKAGAPADAGEGFAAHADRVRNRVLRADWLAVGPEEAAFTDSPAGLVRWAPIVDELKALDEEVVRNSVRFRWQQVRRDFAQLLVLDSMLKCLPTDP
jgi:hypothetical protein